MIKIAFMAEYQVLFQSKEWLVDLTVFEAHRTLTSHQVLKRWAPVGAKSRIFIQNEVGDVYKI